MKVLLFVKLFLILSLVSSISYAQTGKIVGTVKESGTGAPLPGVTVQIESLQKGTSTDTDGHYVLLSVPAGKHVVTFSFIGFSTQTIENVEVNTGRTTTIDAEMQEEVFEGEEIVIKAEKPIVKKDQTSSVSFINRESIEELPVLEVSDLVKFQPGVVTTSDGGFSFRGGRTREVAYIIDGIPVQNVYSQGGGNTIDVEVQSIQELQVLTGTFDAEMGGAQSGVVNVTTRDPAKKLEADLQIRTGGYFDGDKDLFMEGNVFDPVQTKDVSFTLTGPIIKKNDKLGFFLSSRYEDRVGYLKGKRQFTVQDGQAIDAYKTWYRNVYSPDDARLIALDTARTPNGEKILDSNGNVITFAHGDGKIIDMDWRKTFTLNPKLVYRLSTRTKLSYSAIYNLSEGQGYSDSKRYAPDGRNKYENNSLTQILALKQSFSNNFILNLRGSYKFATSKNRTYEDFNDPRYTYYSSSDETTGFYFGGTENGRGKFEEEQIIVSGDFTWQINYSNEIKSGFQYRYNSFKSTSQSIGWYLASDSTRQPVDVVRPENAGSYRYFDQYLLAYNDIELARAYSWELTGDKPVYEQKPVEFAAFIQDKLELGSNLVVKGGLRFEYYNTGEKQISNTREQSGLIGAESNLKKSDPKIYLSPRIGISYPISDKGAFRVAYGHFTQMPAYSKMFQNPVSENTNQGRLEGATIGNPDLNPEKTIKYEMGLQQQISDFIGLDINLFYKNVRNLLGLEILSTSDGITYYRTVNRDYGLIKGGTISLFTSSKGYLNSAGFDITYQDAQGSSSNPDAIADVIIAGRSGEVGDVVIDRNLIPLDWEQSLTANVYLTIGKPGSWNIGLVNQLATGQPYTPTFLDPYKEYPDNFFDNTEKKPILITLDLSAEKQFNIGESDISFKLQVNNIFNYLNERQVNSVSGHADQIVRLPNDQFERSYVNSYVGLFTDEEDDLRPTWYSSPRQILFSIQLKF